MEQLRQRGLKFSKIAGPYSSSSSSYFFEVGGKILSSRVAGGRYRDKSSSVTGAPHLGQLIARISQRLRSTAQSEFRESTTWRYAPRFQRIMNFETFHSYGWKKVLNPWTVARSSHQKSAQIGCSSFELWRNIIPPTRIALDRLHVPWHPTRFIIIGPVTFLRSSTMEAVGVGGVDDSAAPGASGNSIIERVRLRSGKHPIRALSCASKQSSVILYTPTLRHRDEATAECIAACRRGVIILVSRQSLSLCLAGSHAHYTTAPSQSIKFHFFFFFYLLDLRVALPGKSNGYSTSDSVLIHQSFE